MSPLNQNLFLFFEENEITSLINRKLVKLYMNRCIIDEDANFEIIGVYELQTVNDQMYNSLNPLYKTSAYQRTYKESVDRDIFTEALEKAFVHETNSIDNHFIIGSSFHSVDLNSQILYRADKLLCWLLNEVKSQEIRNLYVTILAGARYNLITKEVHKKAYDGKMSACIAVLGPRRESIHPKISVNDDFEFSIKLIRQGKRLQQNIPLFLQPMLTPYQLKLMKTKDESFLESFTYHKIFGVEADVSEEELKLFPDSDPRLRFFNCVCIRQSCYLKSS